MGQQLDWNQVFLFSKGFLLIFCNTICDTWKKINQDNWALILDMSKENNRVFVQIWWNDVWQIFNT